MSTQGVLAKLHYQFKENRLTLVGELTRSAVCEAIRRHEAPGFSLQAKENLAWPLLQESVVGMLRQEHREDLPLTIDISHVNSIDSIGLAGLLHLLEAAKLVNSQVVLDGRTADFDQMVRLYHLEEIISNKATETARHPPLPT